MQRQSLARERVAHTRDRLPQTIVRAEMFAASRALHVDHIEKNRSARSISALRRIRGRSEKIG
jgi:hypothetical protein